MTSNLSEATLYSLLPEIQAFTLTSVAFVFALKTIKTGSVSPEKVAIVVPAVRAWTPDTSTSDMLANVAALTLEMQSTANANNATSETKFFVDIMVCGNLVKILTPRQFINLMV
jgi:hypothetical protein